MLVTTRLASHRSSTAGRLLMQATAIHGHITTRHKCQVIITQAYCKGLTTCQRDLNRRGSIWSCNLQVKTDSHVGAHSTWRLGQTLHKIIPMQRMFSVSAWRSIPRGTMMEDILKEERRKSLLAEEEEWDAEMEESGSKEDEESSEEEEEISDTARPHIPVMLKEVINFLDPRENQVLLDMTFGAGGHTEAILQQCENCRVIALDRDPVAYELATNMAEKYGKDRLIPLLGRFSDVSALLQKSNIAPGCIDGVLIDAGCSSMQFDTAERGFALSKDGPLDMRMDGQRVANQPTAADVVNSLDALTLANILYTYGEEPKSKKIAKTIIKYREKYRPIQTTQELATVVSYAFTHRQAKETRDGIGRHSHVATKTFMALRIFVNNELNELSAGLQAVETFLKPGSKLAVLSFHSMEDRIVKRYMQGKAVNEKSKTLHQMRKAAASEDVDSDESDVKTVASPQWDMCKDLQMASPEEIEMNPRSRSAKLRTAIKL